MRRVLAIVVSSGCGFNAPSAPPIDAVAGDTGPAVDAPGTGLDAAAPTICLGPTGTDWELCLGHTTMLPDVALPPAIDTDTSPLCLVAQPTLWLPEQRPACFVVGTNVTVPGTTRATGSRPLVIVGIETVQIGGSLDVSSPRGQARGAGSGIPGACPAFALGPQSGGDDPAGGGAGGTLTTAGGGGGTAQGDEGTNQGGQPGAIVTAPSTLRGGCDGQAGGRNNDDVGHGGGAVYVVAGTQIAVAGSIDASGGGGEGDDDHAGGNGGGSGGMIVLHAPTITGGGSVRANGGGGSGGGSEKTDGPDGGDSMSWQTPAAGGGNGGAGYADGTDATPGTQTTDRGGGGGGGGAGYVRASVMIANSSPPAAVVP